MGEQLFVREAKRAAAGKKVRWQVGESHPDYKIGSKSYADMMKAGIIDPTKVVRLALQGAASVAGLLVTTEAMVAEKADEGTSSTPGGMGGAL